MPIAAKRERHRRFWQPLTRGEGGYLGVTAPIDDAPVKPYLLPPPRNLEEQWLSAEYRVKRAEADTQNIFWGQDALNNAFVNLGPGVHAALLGAPFALQPHTIWFDLDPPLKNLSDAMQMTTNTAHVLYQTIAQQTRALCAASGGRYAVSLTDIGGQLDILFSLRGETLLTDLIEDPDGVLAAQNRLDDALIHYFKDCVAQIDPACGYTTWMPLLCDVPWYALQCDLSVMISKAMFEKFVLPSLDKVSAAVGQSIYHLDGPGEIQHLDMILSLQHVHAIQWVPLPNKRTADGKQYVQDFADEQSIDVYRRSLAAGKKVCLLSVRPEQVKPIFEAVGGDGMYIQTHCATRQAADALIAHAKKEWLVL